MEICLNLNGENILRVSRTDKLLWRLSYPDNACDIKSCNSFFDPAEFLSDSAMSAGAGLKQPRAAAATSVSPAPAQVAVRFRGDKFVSGVINRVHHGVSKKAFATAVEESGQPVDRWLRGDQFRVLEYVAVAISRPRGQMSSHR
jgi:hypothetical protein